MKLMVLTRSKDRQLAINCSYHTQWLIDNLIHAPIARQLVINSIAHITCHASKQWLMQQCNSIFSQSVLLNINCCPMLADKYVDNNDYRLCFLKLDLQSCAPGDINLQCCQGGRSIPLDPPRMSVLHTLSTYVIEIFIVT